MVAKAGPDECWLWTGQGGKYGLMWRREAEGGRITAHRYSYELHHGPIPAGMFVLHSCDTPRCVNPAHLNVGTPKENMDDMWRKGRAKPTSNRGEERSISVLTDDAVRFIRAHPEMRMTDLAARFGVVPNTIRAVRRGKTWTHVT